VSKTEEEFDPARAEIYRQAIGRWENEGGSLDGWSHQEKGATVAGEIGDAEAGNTKVRLIALELFRGPVLMSAPDRICRHHSSGMIWSLRQSLRVEGIRRR
jgi:hypothetical protein